MKRIVWCVLITVIFVGCSKKEIESDLPVQIGQSRTEVKQILGSPNRTGDDFDSFYDYGLVVDYGSKNEVASITASRLKSGVEFRGRILGVVIGDPVTKCVELWGNSDKWDETPFEHSIVVFTHEGYRIELEVWSKDGTDLSLIHI